MLLYPDLRNLLKYEKISDITLVDLDPKITDLAKNQVDLVTLNQWALLNDKVTIIHWDAFNYFKKTVKKYDLIIADFPDPRDVGTAKLYSKEMYMWINKILKVRSGLINIGLKRGDKVISLLDNSYDQIVLFFSCITLGIIWVPIGSSRKGLGLNYILSLINPKKIFSKKKNIIYGIKVPKKTTRTPAPNPINNPNFVEIKDFLFKLEVFKYLKI